MCGIAGIYYFDRKTEKDNVNQTVEELLLSLSHRGPDDKGKVIYNSFGMGMTRLSIIDLDKGHQPIFDAENRYSIVFNGEIYNYQLLRENLYKEGIKFKTQSDTEVILLGYLKKGVSFLDSLEGMFSFVIYDSHEHKLFMTRDRLGKKPLYYYKDNEKLVFSSEVQGLLKLESLNCSIDEQAYWDYLTFRYVPDEHTTINKINKFKPGHFAHVSSNTINIKEYWKIPLSKEHAIDTFHSGLINDFASLFAESVKKRLVSDVPVGIVLSGGIDSCAILYEASKHQKINSYHVYFKNSKFDYNELNYARLMAEHVNSKLNIIEVNENDFIDYLSKMSSITDEPLSDLASIPFKFVCDLAAKDVKVVLSGEGADEIMAGYGSNSIYKKLCLLKLLRSNSFSRYLAIRLSTFFSDSRKDKINQYFNLGKSWGEATNYNITFQADQSLKLSLMNDANHNFLDSSRIIQTIYRNNKFEDSLNQMLHVISRDWLVENVLMKSDKVSMSSSIEVRCPFLDHKLVEKLFQLPGKYKVGFYRKKFESKILLRKYLANKIPEEIIRRKKLGFPVPAYNLQSKKYRDYIFDVLNSSNCYYNRIFKKDKIIDLFSLAIKNNTNSESRLKHFIWSIVTFEQWFKSRSKYISN